MAPITLHPFKATEPGALDGFGVACPLCTERHGTRFVNTSSLESLARQYAAGHARWHASRGDR